MPHTGWAAAPRRVEVGMSPCSPSLATLVRRTACAPTWLLHSGTCMCPRAPATGALRQRTESRTGDNPSAQQQPTRESTTRSRLERGSAGRTSEAAATHDRQTRLGDRSAERRRGKARA